MKVKKLIKQLGKLDPSLEVYCFGYEGGCHEPLEVVDTTTTDGVFLLDSPVPDEDGDEEEEDEEEDVQAHQEPGVVEDPSRVVQSDKQRAAGLEFVHTTATATAGIFVVKPVGFTPGSKVAIEMPLAVSKIRTYIIHGLSANNQYARDCLGEFNALPGVQQIKSKVTFE